MTCADSGGAYGGRVGWRLFPITSCLARGNKVALNECCLNRRLVRYTGEFGLRLGRALWEEVEQLTLQRKPYNRAARRKDEQWSVDGVSDQSGRDHCHEDRNRGRDG